MSLVSAKSGINLFHYNLIGTGTILSYDARKCIMYVIQEKTGAVLSMKPAGKLSYDEFVDNSREFFLNIINISN